MKKILTELSTLDGVLSAFEPRYIRIAKHGKTPIDKDWPINPMTASNPILSKWIDEGGNYGVIASTGLIVIDVDKLDAIKKAEQLPPSHVKAIPNRAAVLMFPADILIEDVLKSLDIIKADLQHA